MITLTHAFHATHDWKVAVQAMGLVSVKFDNPQRRFHDSHVPDHTDI